VIVVRALEYVAPHVISDDKFTAGHPLAEARIYDVQGGEHGGFRTR
jgi:hypothetical protein